MSILKDRNKEPVKKITGENTSEIKKDKSGKEYSLVQHTTENVVKGDTIRPGNAPRVDNFIQGGDYTIIETKPKNFKIKDDYSSMRSMGQAISAWTSPMKLKEGLGDPVAASSPEYDKYQSRLKKQFRSSKDSGVGYYYDNGNMMYFDKKHFEPTKPGEAPTKTKGGSFKNGAWVKKGEKITSLSKAKKGPIPNYKPKAKAKAKPLEKVEKRGGKGFEGFTRTNLMGPSQPGDSDYQTNIVSKEEEAQDRERKDMARMQRAVDSANAPEKLMEGLSRKEKRQMARYDSKKERGLTPQKAADLTKKWQTVGSFLADLKPGGTDVEKAGVANDPSKNKKEDDPNGNNTYEPTDFGEIKVNKLSNKT